MKIYVDTNVLIAAAIGDHPHHHPAFGLLSAVRRGTFEAFISTHGLAEYYSVLTRSPFTPRVHPVEAGRLLDDNILPYFELVALSASDYKKVLSTCSREGLIGGMVYDALHLQGASKAGCKRLYTFNVKDFKALELFGFNGDITAP